MSTTSTDRRGLRVAEMARLAALRAEMVAMLQSLPSAQCPPPTPGTWCPPTEGR